MNTKIKFLGGEITTNYKWQLPDEKSLRIAKENLAKMYPVEGTRIYLDEESNTVNMHSNLLLNHKHKEDEAFSTAINMATSLLETIVSPGFNDHGVSDEQS